MITELILYRLLTKEAELKALQEEHQRMMDFFQRKTIENQQRYAQLQGAIAELKELQQYELPSDILGGNGGERQPGAPFDRVPGARNNSGDHMGTPLVHRELDTPDPPAGETGAGNHPPDTGDPVGGAEFCGR